MIADQDPMGGHDTHSPRSAGAPPAVPLAPRQPFKEISVRDRGYLPHWTIEGAVYFITFRLADSIPKAIVEQIELERNRAIDQAIKSGEMITGTQRKRLLMRFSKKIDDYLDKGIGSCVLAKPQAAGIVVDTLVLFQQKRYRLFAWCVMPNHVHVVFRPFSSYQLSSIIHSWKSYTAKEINKLLRKEGRLWQPERYDRVIRDEQEFWRTTEYVVSNPIRAGLKDWQWVWWYGGDTG